LLGARRAPYHTGDLALRLPPNAELRSGAKRGAPRSERSQRSPQRSGAWRCPMSGWRAVPIGFFLLCLTSGVLGQAPAPPSGPPGAPGVRMLTGADEERAKRLDEQIKKAMNEDRWEEAIARAEELLALRSRVQGAGQFEAVDA